MQKKFINNYRHRVEAKKNNGRWLPENKINDRWASFDRKLVCQCCKLDEKRLRENKQKLENK